MTRASIERRAGSARLRHDIAAELVRLEALSNFELRGEWRRLHHMQPPKSLSRELLLRGITYKIQERAFGGLSKSILRKLSGTEPEASSAENRGTEIGRASCRERV